MFICGLDLNNTEDYWQQLSTLYIICAVAKMIIQLSFFVVYDVNGIFLHFRTIIMIVKSLLNSADIYGDKQ